MEHAKKMMETYSYLFHLTVISNNLGCVGSIGSFLWNNTKSPHSWHLLPPTHLLLKNTFLGSLLHSIVEIKSRTFWGAGSPSQCFLQKSTNVSYAYSNWTWYRQQQVSRIIFGLIYHGFNLLNMVNEICTLGFDSLNSSSKATHVISITCLQCSL